MTEVAVTDEAIETKRARLAAFFAGARQCIVFMPSYVPFGMVCGVAAVQAGLGEWGALGAAALVFAGSSQAVLTQFLSGGAPLLMAVASGLVVNLRMAVYSAAISQRVSGASRKERVLWAAFLVDQTFILNEARHQRGEHMNHALAFYLGCAMVIWPFWIFTNALGAFAGAKVPASWQLDFTIPLSFVAMVVPMLKTRAHLAAALAGAIAGVALYALPLKTGLIAACVFGTCVGMLVDTFFKRKHEVSL
ncbi:MAG: branched-chain amino acid ABC transporter permease [Betaproteobacteria bacterium]|nr:MAG: branched-chain amino acid ABC transporter permease [Betaproteobacteria bacterium]